MCKYYAFKEAPNSNCNVHVAYFKRGFTTITNVQIKKSFKPTSIPKNCGLKLLPNSSENTLSDKSKYLYQLITFYTK